ncbi:carbohydrate kinase family protein, partial [Actinoallomurus acaciae]
SAAIVACGAARLGLSTALAATVGRDAAGDFVLDTLRAAGVDIGNCVRHESLPTALTVCLNRPDGDRAILTAPGCLPAFDSSQVPEVSARHVHAASYFLQPRLAAGLPGLLSRFRRAGASTSLDTNDDPAGEWRLTPGLLAACDFVLPNEAEALALAGALTGEPVSALPAALTTLAKAGPVPVVKRGGEGAVARYEDTDVSARGPRVTPSDTVGAGDGFDAGFLAGWLGRQDIEEALAWGCACGALSTRAAGGTAAQATATEAETAAAEMRVTRERT